MGEKKKRGLYKRVTGDYGEYTGFIVLILAVIIDIIIMFILSFKIFNLSPDITTNAGISISIIGLSVSAFFSFKYAEEYRSYIKEFRGYITDLDDLLKKASELIEKAEDSIEIAVEFFGIGSATAPIGHDAYIGSLIKMAHARKKRDQNKKIDITVIALSDEEAKRRTEVEFPTKTITEPSFISQVLEKDKKICDSMKHEGIKAKHHNSIPFQLFIIDDKKALFYIGTRVKENGGERKTIGYVTEDSRMIDVLRQLFKNIDEESKPC
jgi:hypothetical protein